MITTYSAFYYGHTLTEENRYLNFKEGAGPMLELKMPIGAMTLTKFRTQLELQLNSVGSLDWTVALDRITRKLTISASGSFSFLGATGPRSLQSLLPLMGFENIDYSVASFITAPFGCGSSYEPQFMLQEYLSPEDNKGAASATVSKSASGQKVTVQKFGIEKRMKCNIMFITDIAQPPDHPIKNNQNGVLDANNFMSYCVDKAPIEFIPDINSPDVYYKMILDSTPESQDGIEYELKEAYANNRAFYFDTGRLTFKLIQES